MFWRCDTRFGLLLKGMKNINRLAELHGINCSIRIAVIVFSNLDNSSAAEALHRFCVGMFSSGLRDLQRESHVRLCRPRKLFQIAFAAADPYYRLERFPFPRSHGS